MHTSEIKSLVESVQAGLACCLNQKSGSCRLAITSRCEIITEQNSRKEECHVNSEVVPVPHGGVVSMVAE